MRQVLVCTLLCVSVVSFAQSQAPCDTDQHAGFDFWIGEWEVADTAGNQLGQNLIQKVENGCLITEEWTSVTGGTGRSMNYYDPSDETWNQLWVSGDGTILRLKGVAKDQQMTLISEAYDDGAGGTLFHRIIWTLHRDETVTQLWEAINENDEVTSEIFRGVYTKKAND